MPIVVSGFEPLDILQGTLITIRPLETERSEVENQYSWILDRDANKAAQKLVFQVFQIGDRKWRGIGTIPKSGYPLRPEFAEHDAARQNGEDPPMHCMRDPTRRGVAMTLNEIASQSKVGMFLREDQIPVRESVQGACEILGLGPLYGQTRESWWPSSRQRQRRPFCATCKVIH